MTARPKYRRNSAPSTELPLDRWNSLDSDGNDSKNGRVGPYGSKLISGGSRTLKWAIKQLRPVQVCQLTEEFYHTLFSYASICILYSAI